MNEFAVDDLHRRLESHQIKGFLAPDEAAALYECALEASHLGPCLEIGSYCGKSAVYIGTACRNSGNTLFTVDHHRGSEEHQLGEEYHDPDLYDARSGRMDTFPALRKALELFDLLDAVVPVVATSAIAAKKWATPLGMVFIDGGHSHEQARADCLTWSRHVISGGLLAIHDIFSDPAQGGQGPYLALQAVLESGDFSWIRTVNSLGILRRH